MTEITILALLLYLAITLLVGFWSTKKQTGRTESEFYVTGWTTGYIGIAFSIMATSASASYVMGTIGKFYEAPAALTGYVLGFAAAPFLLWLIGRKIYVLGKKYQYSTYTDLIGDFYQSEKLRVVVSVLMIIFFTPYLAVNLMGPGILLSQVSGGRIPFWAGALAIAVVGTLYTLRGGMRAVIWTDVLQGGVLIAGFTILIIVMFFAGGGWGRVWASVPDSIALFKPGGGTFWLFFSWMFMIGFISASLPDRAFRLFTASNLKTLRKGIITSLILLNVQGLIGLFMGVALAATIPGITQTDLAIGEAINQFAPYLIPLFVIIVWAGGMSTLDSGMIAVGAMFTKDVYRRNINKKATDDQVFVLSQIIILILGILAFIVAILNPKDLWFFTGGANNIAAQWIPMLIGALYWKRATTAGAWAGFIGGLTVTALFHYVIPCPVVGPGGSAVMGIPINILLFIIVSLATQPMDTKHILRYQQLDSEETTAVRVEDITITQETT